MGVGEENVPREVDGRLCSRLYRATWENPPCALDVRITPETELCLQPGDLLVVLRVEADHKNFQQPVKEYPIGIPTLEPVGGTYGVVGGSSVR